MAFVMVVKHMISLDVFKVYCKYIKRRAKSAAHDDFVRQHYTEVHNKRVHEQCVATVRSVWDINKFRNKVTSRLLDCAVYEGASIVPLLQQCKKVHNIERKQVMEEGGCDISGDTVMNRVSIKLRGTEYVLRSDIANVVLYFHVLVWYPLYLMSLYTKFVYVNEEEEYNLFCFMHNVCDSVILANVH